MDDDSLEPREATTAAGVAPTTPAASGPVEIPPEFRDQCARHKEYKRQGPPSGRRYTDADIGETRTALSSRLLDAGEQLQPTSSAPPPPPPPPPGAPGAPLKASVPERPNTEEGQGSRTIAGAAARAGAVTATAAAAEASASAEPEITTGTVKAITAVTTAIAPGTEARANPERAAAVAGPAVTVVRPPFSSATGTGNAAAAAAAAAADNSGSSSGDSRAAGAPPALTSGGAKRKLGPERTREGRSESPQKFALSGNNVGGGGGGSGGAVGKRLSGEGSVGVGAGGEVVALRP